MQQNPFAHMQDGCKFNAGHVTTYGVHIGPCHGDANSINITTHHAAPMWYEGPPQGVFYEGFMPPGAPGFGGGPRAQAMTISMANDNYKDRNVDNDRDKDKFRDNVNRKDNNNASQVNDTCDVNTDDNDTVNNDEHTYSTIVCSVSSYTKRHRVKWTLHLKNCNARDTGQKCSNTDDLRETQSTRGIDTTTFEQFEETSLTTAMSALPEVLLKELVSMDELTGDMDYVISFEEDQGEGNGGPAQPPP
jgi:hypothetical protein